ncbi:hypothetical protein GOP47_0010379 [Adiantum capillus-veneris]|uniref:Uncharacterized protein n=1 Tax=Adiantum capillus-veneris TaxID=13818 RepID=A0A9D4UVR7_ADICA|nr:hypothetical protein GOP47_0010379 [Adiantum capillus-veneris]
MQGEYNLYWMFASTQGGHSHTGIECSNRSQDCGAQQERTGQPERRRGRPAERVHRLHACSYAEKGLDLGAIYFSVAMTCVCKGSGVRAWVILVPAGAEQAMNGRTVPKGGSERRHTGSEKAEREGTQGPKRMVRMNRGYNSFAFKFARFV